MEGAQVLLFAKDEVSYFLEQDETLLRKILITAVEFVRH
jgi:hypothetical protein